MLFAASESAVTKNPRLRLMMRRSSSESPLGSFHRAMSRVMLTSCGIQWLAQVARYFSQAHLYLNGTSWLTSVPPLMTRLSSARMRRNSVLSDDLATGEGFVVLPATAPTATANPAFTPMSSSKLSIFFLVPRLLLAGLAFGIVDGTEFRCLRL